MKKVRFDEVSYQWLMDATAPKPLSPNASLGEYVRNETLRDLREKIAVMQSRA